MGLLCSNVLLAQQPYSFKTTSDSIEITVDPNKNWSKLKVYRGYHTRQQLDSKSPIIGQISQSNGIIVFKPIVPFSKLIKYTIDIDDYLYYFELGLPMDYSYPVVENIYPIENEWPANILKFHIKFNRPVNIVKVYDHIFITDQDGKRLERMLLDLGQAITDDDQTMLTVWIEPGRQKRSLKPNQELGPPFEIGKKYFIVIDAAIKDKNGIPMKSPFIKEIRIIDADRIKPNPESWAINTPKANHLQPLSIIINESLDYKSALSKVFITFNKADVSGYFSYNSVDKNLLFYPNLPWKKGHYTLHIDPYLEDLAGNSPERLFDTEIFEKKEKSPENKLIIDFKIK